MVDVAACHEPVHAHLILKTYICICTYIYTSTYVYIHVQIRTCIYIYIYIYYINTYIYIYKYLMYIIHIYVYYIYICITGNICLKKRRCPDLWGLLALEEHKLALKTQRETERRRERKRKRNRETIFHDSKCSGERCFQNFCKFVNFYLGRAHVGHVEHDLIKKIILTIQLSTKITM